MSYFPQILGQGESNGSWYPISRDALASGNIANLRLDTAGNLETRSSVLTDEGSFYDPFSGGALSSSWTQMLGSGGSITLLNSVCNIISGTTNDAETGIYRQVDFSPLTFSYMLQVSQRIANQTVYFGMGNHPTTPSSDTAFARFRMTGTDNTIVWCETRSSSGLGGDEGQATPIILPDGLNTGQNLHYMIDFDGTAVDFYVGLNHSTMKLIATHSAQIPDPYAIMYQRVRIVNGTGAATTTTVSVDSAAAKNINLISTESKVTGDVSVQQNVVASAVNSWSTTAPLVYNTSLTGSGESTLGIAGIQVNFIADQICRVDVQQSIDNVNWDITDSWTTVAAVGDSRTFQATGSYYRVIITNRSLTAASTSYIRCQTALCPIVEALPRALTSGGTLKTTLYDYKSGAKADCDGDSKLQVNDGGSTILRNQFTETVDQSFWDLATTGAGSYSVSTSLNLATTTASGDSALINSKLLYEISTGLLARFSIDVSFDNTSAANSTRTWGMINVVRTDGVYFSLKNGSFYAATIKGGVETATDITAYKPAADTFNRYEIQFSGFRAYWFINGVLVYSVDTSGSSPLQSANQLKAGALNINTGASTANSLKIFAMTLISPYARSINQRDVEGNVGRISPDGYSFSEGHGTVKFKRLFQDNTLDTTNVWTETIAGAASKSLANTQLSMTVTTAAADSITYNSKQNILYSSGRDFSEIDFGVNLGLTTDANNRREWGSRYNNDGVYFRYSGTTLTGICEANTSLTTQTLPFINDGKLHRFSILKRGINAFYFLIDGVTVGKLFSGTTSIAPLKYDVPYMRNYNTALATNGLTLTIDSISVVDKTTQSMSLIGIDTYKLYREFTVDTLGRLVTTNPSIQSNSGVLSFESTGIATLAANTWRRVLTYTVPTGYTFNLIAFQSVQGANSVFSRCSKVISFGSYNVGTNTFTDGSAYTAPAFASKLIARVTTGMSATGVTLTATYTNQDGLAGQTATAVIPSAAAADYQMEFTLTAGDYGIRDITAMARSATPTGIIAIEGIDELSYHSDVSTNILTESNYGAQAVVVNSGVGGTISLAFMAPNTTSSTRKFKALYSLYLTST